MTQNQSDIHQAEVYRRLKAADETYSKEFDAPIFGNEVKIPLPHWPCGHYFIAVKWLIKLENGKYTYQDAA